MQGTSGDEIVTEQGVHNTVYSFEGYKSPSCDGTYPIMLGQVGAIICSAMVNLYNASLRLRHTLRCWSEGKPGLHSFPFHEENHSKG